MVTCKLCSGEGFIYLDMQGSACPACWGAGKVEIDPAEADEDTVEVED